MLIAAGTIALCIAVLRYRTVAKSLNACLREASPILRRLLSGADA